MKYIVHMHDDYKNIFAYSVYADSEKEAIAKIKKQGHIYKHYKVSIFDPYTTYRAKMLSGY